MVKVKMRNPVSGLQKKIREAVEQFHHMPSDLSIEKRIDDQRVFKIGCKVETDIFNQTTVAKNCDVSIIIDPKNQHPKDENIVGNINIDFSNAPQSSPQQKPQPQPQPQPSVVFDDEPDDDIDLG